MVLAGVYDEDIELLETILVDGSYTLGNFAENLANDNTKFVYADRELNKIIEDVSKEDDIPIRKENIACTECFDLYVNDMDVIIDKFPKDKNIVGNEMESFALFYTAKTLNKRAGCLLTVVDSLRKKQSLTAEERQKSLNDMIKIALDSAIKLT